MPTQGSMESVDNDTGIGDAIYTLGDANEDNTVWGRVNSI